MDVRPDPPRPPLVMVVQRGDEERYRLLRTLFQNGRVDVVLDRRSGDRRGPGARHQGDIPNRRSGERRAPLPDTWVNLGFFVARRHNP